MYTKIIDRWTISFTNGDGSGEVTPARVKNVSMEADYRNGFHPALNMTLEFNAPSMVSIRKRASKLIGHVEHIQDLMNADNDTGEENQAPEESRIVLREAFIPIFEEEDLIAVKGLKSPEEFDDDKLDIDEPGDGNTYILRVYLTTVSYNMSWKKSYNQVMRGPDGNPIKVGSVLQFIGETCGAEKYIVDVPDNEIPYENIILPPGNLRYSIEALQMMYGIYMTGLSAFYDIDNTLYILNRYKSSHEIEDGGVSLIKVTNHLSRGDNAIKTAAMSRHGSFEIDNGIAIMRVVDAVNEMEPAISDGEADGDIILHTNYGYGQNTFIFNKGKYSESLDPIRSFMREVLSHEFSNTGASYEYDELNNPFNLLSALKEDGTKSVIAVGVAGVDTRLLKPNVRFNLEMTGGTEEDTEKFSKSEDFPIQGYAVEWTNKSGPAQDVDVFESKGFIMLTRLK